jgi:hypothetical protein
MPPRSRTVPARLLMAAIVLAARAGGGGGASPSAGPLDCHWPVVPVVLRQGADTVYQSRTFEAEQLPGEAALFATFDGPAASFDRLYARR